MALCIVIVTVVLYFCLCVFVIITPVTLLAELFRFAYYILFHLRAAAVKVVLVALALVHD